MERKSILFISAVLIAAGILFAGCATQTPGTVTPTPVSTETTEITAVPTTELTTAPLTTEITAELTKTKIIVPSTPPAAGMNIIDTLAADGRFTTMVTLLKAAQLDGNLRGPGPFTVFAPTDDAFKKLPDGTVDSLLKDPQGYYLNKMLQYHEVNGKLMAADIMRVGSINTLAGQPLLIGVSNGVIFVNGDAEVITTDVMCSNGVIQVIDTVLNPPQ